MSNRTAQVVLIIALCATLALGITNDVGVTSIIAPSGLFCTCDTIRPVTCRVTSFGTANQTEVPVYVRVRDGIGGVIVYQGSTTCSAPAGQTVTVNFPLGPGEINPTGHNTILYDTCWTDLATDQNRSNDTAISFVTVNIMDADGRYLHDVAVWSIDVPPPVIDYNTTFIPEATFTNVGLKSRPGSHVAFWITDTDGNRICLGSGNVPGMALGATTSMTFPFEITPPPGWYMDSAVITCSGHDANRSNDTMEQALRVVSLNPDPWGGSTLTQGYWKNHPYYDPQYPDAPYIQEYLPLTIAGVTVGNVPQALAVFDPPKPITAWKMFLIQFLAAKLNVGWQNSPSLLAAWYNYPGGDYPFDNGRVFDIFQVADGYEPTMDKTTLEEMKTVLCNINEYTDTGNHCLWDAPFPPGSGPQGAEVSGLASKLILPVASSPAKRGIISISYSLPTAGPAQLKVVDMAGRTVMTQSIPVAVGDNVISLDARSWGAGVYLVRLDAGEQQVTRKLVVQR